MAGDLELKCALAGTTNDHLTMTTDVEGGFALDNGVIAIATIADEDRSASWYLTEDTARELFNWLGVLLHTAR